MVDSNFESVFLFVCSYSTHVTNEIGSTLSFFFREAKKKPAHRPQQRASNEDNVMLFVKTREPAAAFECNLKGAYLTGTLPPAVDWLPGLEEGLSVCWDSDVCSPRVNRGQQQASDPKCVIEL